MNESVFSQQYANQFDQLYADKDYEAECDLLERAFRRYRKEPVRSILDLGCGTGNHSIPLALRGYQVHGVDLSEHMLAHAVEKVQAAAPNRPPIFSRGDIRDFDLGEQFSATLMMFAVLGYQLTNNDVLAAFHNVRRHLEPGGLFIFDVWYGPAVLAIRPSDRVKEIPTEDGKLIRSASAALDVNRHLVEVCYQTRRLSGDHLVEEARECHVMRFFFAEELAAFLSQCGLKQESLSAFPSLDRSADETTWNVMVVSRAA